MNSEPALRQECTRCFLCRSWLYCHVNDMEQRWLSGRLWEHVAHEVMQSHCALPRAPHLVLYSVIAVWKFLILFQHEALHFHFAWGSANDAAGLDYYIFIHTFKIDLWSQAWHMVLERSEQSRIAHLHGVSFALLGSKRVNYLLNVTQWIRGCPRSKSELLSTVPSPFQPKAGKCLTGHQPQKYPYGSKCFRCVNALQQLVLGSRKWRSERLGNWPSHTPGKEQSQDQEPKQTGWEPSSEPLQHTAFWSHHSGNGSLL